MKDVTVHYKNPDQGLADGWLLEDIEDLNFVSNYLMRKATDLTRRAIKSEFDIFDVHYQDSLVGAERPLCYIAENESLFKAGGPIFHLENAAKLLLNTLATFVAKGRQVFLKESFGCFPITKNYLEVVEVRDFTGFEKPTKPKIRKGAKVINLENDPLLEDHAKEYMASRWGDYSFIIRLRNYNESDLENTFRDFKEVGGKDIYVYTTGIDVDQMYLYSNAAMEANLYSFVFKFKGGINKEIKEFLKWLEARAEVEIVEPITV